jgi:hypothetical protein
MYRKKLKPAKISENLIHKIIIQSTGQISRFHIVMSAHSIADSTQPNSCLPCQNLRPLFFFNLYISFSYSSHSFLQGGGRGFPVLERGASPSPPSLLHHRRRKGKGKAATQRRGSPLFNQPFPLRK